MRNKIIAFSGLGGAGKSTCIKHIQKYIGTQKKVTIIALRDYFIFPKITAGIHNKTKFTNNKAPQAKPIKSSTRITKLAYYFARDCFYIVDAIRIRLTILALPCLNKNIIIYDRSPIDFVIELAKDSPYYFLHTIFIKMFPKPGVHFYLDIKPSTAYTRKAEHPIQYLEYQYQEYDRYIERFKMFSLSAEASVKDTTESIETITSQYLITTGGFSAHNYLLWLVCTNPNSVILNKAYQFDRQLMIKCAAYNRVTSKYLENIAVLSNITEKNTVLKTAIIHQQYILKRREKTLKFIKETLTIPLYGLIKDDTEQYELGSDIDIVFDTQKNYKQAITILRKNGFSIQEQSDRKADAFRDDMLPIDLHFDLAYGNFVYADSEKLAEENHDVSQLLTIVGHAVAELTLCTLGDILKNKEKYTNEHIIIRSAQIAKKMGWASGYHEWLRKASLVKHGNYLYPYRLSVFSLLVSRLGLWLHSRLNVKNLILDLLQLAKALRARRLGNIPFHEPWITPFLKNSSNEDPSTKESHR